MYEFIITCITPTHGISISTVFKTQMNVANSKETEKMKKKQTRRQVKRRSVLRNCKMEALRHVTMRGGKPGSRIPNETLERKNE